MSTSYSVTRDAIIIAALRKVGVAEPNDTVSSGTIDPNILSNAQMNLNVMVKQWATEGLKLWTNTEIILPLVATQTSYKVGPTAPDLVTDKPLKIVQSWLRNTAVTPNIDIPMTVISQQEYKMLGSKFATGVVNSVYLRVDVAYSEIYVFVTPDTLTAATYALYLIVQRGMADITTGSTDVQILDFPNEWFNALVWNLADDLAIEFSVPQDRRSEIALRAKGYRDQLNDWDVEAVSTFFTPDARMYAARGY